MIGSLVKENIFKKLKENKNILKTNSLNLLEQSQKDFHKVIFENTCDQSISDFLNIDSAKKHIEETLENPENPSCFLRGSYDNHFTGNEIKFALSVPSKYTWNTPEEQIYRMKKRKLHFQCEKEFWNNNEMVIWYNECSNFKCFTDITFDAKLESKYKRSSKLLFNTNDWMIYIQRLITEFFPDFNYSRSHSSSEITRFVKSINETYLLGIEFYKGFSKREFNKGDASLFYYFNIILAEMRFDKKLRHSDYIGKENDTIFSLGILGNPFFYEPCLELRSFQSIETHTNLEDVNYFGYNYKEEFRNNGDGTITMIFSDELGEKLKKHAFFYFYLLSYSSKGYIDYLEKSIKEALGEEVGNVSENHFL